MSRPSENVVHLLQSNKQHDGPDPSGSHLCHLSNGSAFRSTLSSININAPTSSAPLALTANPSTTEAEDDSNWDTDFEGAISVQTKLQGDSHLFFDERHINISAVPDKPDSVVDHAQTIRPTRLSNSPQASVTKGQLEDYSDLVEDDDGTFAGRVAQMRVRLMLRKPM